MILECTECRTRYLVPDTAIGPDGRTVRCANCKHSWFQPPAGALDLAPRAEVQPTPPKAPAPPPKPVEAPPVVEIAPPGTAEEFDAFAHRPPFRPRRNPARRWTMVAFAAGVAMLAAAAAIVYSGAPGLAQQWGLPILAPETPLRIINYPIDHRDLDNGSEMFAISGRVVNPSSTRQHVPDIRAELRDAQGRLVYSWTIRPEAMTLPAKGSVEFNSAKLDVPINSKKLVLSFSEGGR
jgi:predicted Zn finger-like uncharacterized protein